MHKWLVALLLSIGAAATVWVSFAFRHPAQPSTSPERAPQIARQQEAPAATRPSREALGELRTDVFAERSGTGAPPAVAAIPAQPAARAPDPVFPYRYAGKLVYEGAPLVVLAKGNALFFASQGDTLEEKYRLESIADDRITFRHLQLGLLETITMDSALPGGAPTAAAAPQPTTAPERAQLRWDGPKSVQAGKPFEVALKVSSTQPVYSSPLQLTYDARFLKPVEVRAGAYFAAGEFTSRVSLNGSILVGANATGTLAADAEFFVITFMPTRSGGTAELALSAGFLRGEAGAAIDYDPPVAFRVPIE